MPRLKVHGLRGTDTEQDAQHFQIADPLSQRWVEASATLLNKPKVESGCVGDRLEVVLRGQVGIGSGNGRKLPFQQTRDGWWERVSEEGSDAAA
jgi:hypothetical protein